MILGSARSVDTMGARLGADMPTRDLVVIGASAGGLPALYTILGSLPPDAAGRGRGRRPHPIGRRRAAAGPGTAQPSAGAMAPRDGADLEPGRVYVAPADRHVLVGEKGLRVVHGPRENGFRPAVDPLFRTAARSRGPGVIGVILSGALDDGAHGLSAIVRGGGIAIVQDPDDAEVPSMPLAALRLTQVHAVAPASQIADAIVQFCHEPRAVPTSASAIGSRRIPMTLRRKVRAR